MTTALASLLSGRPVKHTVGMTGEVTLQGRVLPIGGLKQKVLAAHAAGLREVILPERNRADLDDVPRGRPRRDDVPPGHDARGGARVRARARAGGERGMSHPATTARPSPRRSAARRTSSSGAGCSPSCGPRTPAPCASTSSCGRSARVPPRTLAIRLAELEEAGVLERRILDTRPPRVEYRLTPEGRAAGLRRRRPGTRRRRLAASHFTGGGELARRSHDRAKSRRIRPFLRHKSSWRAERAGRAVRACRIAFLWRMAAG